MQQMDECCRQNVEQKTPHIEVHMYDFRNRQSFPIVMEAGSVLTVYVYM